MDRYPDIKLILAHAGGFVPYIAYRILLTMLNAKNKAQQLWALVDQKHQVPKHLAVLKRFYYDVIVFNAQIMRDLIDLVGVERVVMGTDFPQAMAVKQPVDFVESVPRLSPREREMILSLNAQRMLKL